MTDPSSTRARNLVVFVVLMVALPSLLLTGLGAAAVTNEEAAARRRLEKLYYPVALSVAQRFNARLELLLKEASEPLEDLVAWSDGVRADPAKFRDFAGRTPFATNYFVIDQEEGIVTPGPHLDGRTASERLPRGLTKAIAREVRREGHAHACHAYTCAQGCCDLGERHRCTLAYAVAACRATAGDRLFSLRDELRSQGCEAYVDHEVPELGLKLAVLARKRHEDPERFVEEASAMSAILSDPTRATRLDLTEFIARRLADHLKDLEGNDAYRARRLLQAIAERPALLEVLNRMSYPRAHEPQLTAPAVEGWRRVLVTRFFGGRLMGFELLPSSVEPYLQSGLGQGELDKTVSVQVHPTEVPPWWLSDFTPEDDKEFENRAASWTLLSKTDLAWRLALLINDEGGLAFMSRSRSGMYLWALVLIVFALVVGIGSTVRAVIREARISRLKTDFVSSVSHDLRTPLTSIRMFTETLILGRVSDPREEKEFLQVIADEAERLSRLTERILDFSRMEAGRKSYTFTREEVPSLVQQALGACAPMITEAGLEVETDWDEDLPSIHADRDAMIEVMINLVTNAIKYSGDRRMIRLSAWPEAGVVAFAVQDYGIGIPRAEQKRIFDKFYRVDCRRTSEVGGSGIGLSLVHHIVLAHRGEISVQSAPGEGSTFTVRLPEAPQLRTADILQDASLGVETWKASSS